MAWVDDISRDRRERFRAITLVEVLAEMRLAEDKHGDFAGDGRSVSDIQLLAAIGEEYGEVCRALTYDQDHASSLRKELIQLAATATAWASTLDPETDERTVNY